MHEVVNEQRIPNDGHWVAKRVNEQPIVDAGSHPSIGVNIQGPSAIRVPDWLENPLGRYYLYFADHKGRYIRLAYAQELTGPWQIHEPGSLQLEDSGFPTKPLTPKEVHQESRGLLRTQLPHSFEKEASTPHIASPDVHVDFENKRLVMYYHGLETYGIQRTRIAYSVDGLNFNVEPQILCSSYLRVVRYRKQFLGMTMPGNFYQLKDWDGPFDNPRALFNENFRHHALLLNQSWMYVFWTQVGDTPEHIKVSALDLRQMTSRVTIEHLGVLLKPEMAWEGATEVLEPSIRSVAYGRVNQLRDPAILVDESRVFLFYAGGGESGIGLAELTWLEN